VRTLEARSSQLIDLAWHDPGKVTPQILEGYRKPLRADNWDRALWELTLATGPLALPTRIGEIGVPTIVITGDDDRIVPTEQSVRLAAELPHAELVVIPECGHIPHEEQPSAFLEATLGFLQRIRAQ
jgi:pimeloyl-ACP methyl ester carboxylesterase